jgi:ribosomal protein S27E
MFKLVKIAVLFPILFGILYLPCCQRTEKESRRERLEETEFYPFVDNKDGTITDEVTGLMWTKKAYKSSEPEFDAAECRVAGYLNWRLPTLVELKGLYNSLGLMTHYRATDSKDRTIHPFEWLSSVACSSDKRWAPLMYSPNDYSPVQSEFDFSSGVGGNFRVPYTDGRMITVLGSSIYIRLVRTEEDKGFVVVTCPECNGTGRVSDRSMGFATVCVRCYGKGKIIVESDTLK